MEKWARHGMTTVLGVAQGLAMFAGLCLAVVANLYRPYVSLSVSGEWVGLDSTFFAFQLLLIGWVTSMAVLILRRNVAKNSIFMLVK